MAPRNNDMNSNFSKKNYPLEENDSETEIKNIVPSLLHKKHKVVKIVKSQLLRLQEEGIFCDLFESDLFSQEKQDKKHSEESGSHEENEFEVRRLDTGESDVSEIKDAEKAEVSRAHSKDAEKAEESRAHSKDAEKAEASRAHNTDAEKAEESRAHNTDAEKAEASRAHSKDIRKAKQTERDWTKIESSDADAKRKTKDKTNSVFGFFCKYLSALLLALLLIALLVVWVSAGPLSNSKPHTPIGRSLIRTDSLCNLEKRYLLRWSQSEYLE